MIVDLTYLQITPTTPCLPARIDLYTPSKGNPTGSVKRPAPAPLRPYTPYRIPETTDGREDTTHATLGGARRVPGPPSCAALHRYIIQEAGLSVMTEPWRLACDAGHTSIPHSLGDVWAPLRAPRAPSALMSIMSTPLLAFHIYPRGQARLHPGARSVVQTPWAASRARALRSGARTRDRDDIERSD